MSDGRAIDRAMAGRARSPADSTDALGVSGSFGTGACVAAAAVGVGGPNVGDAESVEVGVTGPTNTVVGVAVPVDAAGGGEGEVVAAGVAGSRGVGVGVGASVGGDVGTGVGGRRGVGVGVGGGAGVGGRRGVGVGVGTGVGGGVGTGVGAGVVDRPKYEVQQLALFRRTAMMLDPAIRKGRMSIGGTLWFVAQEVGGLLTQPPFPQLPTNAPFTYNQIPSSL